MRIRIGISESGERVKEEEESKGGKRRLNTRRGKQNKGMELR